MPDDVFSHGGTNPPGAAAGADGGSLFPNIEEAPVAAAAAAEPARLGFVLNIPVRLSVELGRVDIPIREVVGIDRGSVIELDRSLGQPLDVRVNGVLIGHGEIVVVDEERLGLRFVDVVSPAERVTKLT
jgi:flagellar motor switch protein FliN